MPSSIRAHCLHSPSPTLFYLLYTASISVIRRWMRLGFTTSGKCRSFLSNVSLHPTTSLSHTWHLQLPLRRRFGSFLIILPPSLSGTYGTHCAARMRVCAYSSLLIILPPLPPFFNVNEQNMIYTHYTVENICTLVYIVCRVQLYSSGCRTCWRLCSMAVRFGSSASQSSLPPH